MTKRLFDIVFSLLGLIILAPILLIISILIKANSEGDILYKQKRIGKDGEPFYVNKFRTMVKDADKKGKQITVGNDSRITRVGRVLRKLKLDELPQLINVLKGEMSFVGPRPEVSKYVKLYTKSQREILNIKPGITDYASIYFSNESELLDQADDSEEFYVNKVMPYKIMLNKRYIENKSLVEDVKVICMTLLKIVGLYGEEADMETLREYEEQ